MEQNEQVERRDGLGKNDREIKIIQANGKKEEDAEISSKIVSPWTTRICSYPCIYKKIKQK